MIERTVGHFRIVEQLGRGGMGVVYRAHDEKLDRDVALKLLDERAVESPERRESIVREARAAARIEHPNIARIYELGELDGCPFVVMELVRGETLRERIRKSGPLPTGEALRIADGIAHGLAAAHEAGIVHRDLKPENVALAADGAVKILDFGVAGAWVEPAAVTEDTRTLAIGPAASTGGTVPYMSPEQLAGGAVDGRSDLFALGVVLYEMLAGERPFRGAARTELVDSILRDEPAPLARLREGVPQAVDEVVQRCLAKDPRLRFRDAAEVAAAIGAVRDGRGPSRRLRHRTVAAGALALAAVVAGLVWWSARDSEPPQATGELRVLVAPFAGTGPEAEAEGRVVQQLVERRLRELGASVPVVVLEGRMDRPLASDDAAVEVANDTGADVVVWGTMLRAGAESEIEARLSLAAPLERIGPHGRGTVLPDPRDFLEMVRGVPIDQAGELDALRTSAGDVADLVTTLSGLALIRSGRYDEAGQALASIAAPTPDQRFYQGLAVLRAGHPEDAVKLFRGVLTEEADHVGARLGLVAANSGVTEGGPWGEDTYDLVQDAVAAAPFDPRANAVFFTETFQSAVTGRMTHERDEFFRSQVRRLCEDERGAALPREVREIVLTSVWFGHTLRGAPPADIEALGPELEACPAIVGVLDEADPDLKGLLCIASKATGLRGGICDTWTADPEALNPTLYAALLGNDPSMSEKEAQSRLLDAAEADPRADERAADWAIALSSANVESGRVLEWLRGHPGSDPAKTALAEGVVLLDDDRMPEAEAAFRRGALDDEDDPTLHRFLGYVLLAEGRYEDALNAIGAFPFADMKGLALAASGRWCEAYERGLESVRFRSEDKSADPSADGPSRTFTATASDDLRSLMAELCHEIEASPAARDALAAEMRRRLADATKDPKITFSAGLAMGRDDGPYGIGARVERSIGPDLDLRIPADGLALLDWIESALPGIRDRGQRDEVAGLVQRLSRRMKETAAPDSAGAAGGENGPGTWETLARLGRTDEAEALMRRRLDEAPDDRRASIALADLLVRDGRSEEALAVARAGLEQNPRDGDLERSVGSALVARGDAAGAESALRRALTADPHDATAAYLLGDALRMQGRLDEAFASYADAARASNRAAAHMQMGVVRCRQGRPQDAIAHLERAVERDPGLSRAWLHLADALAATGRDREARDARAKIGALEESSTGGAMRPCRRP